MSLYRETPCKHGYVESHYTCDHIGYPQYNQMSHTQENCHCLGGSREEVTIDYGDMDEVPISEIREALDTYDLKLTKHQEIRLMAHAAEKFLIVDAVLHPT